jgi:hypothetical protein
VIFIDARIAVFSSSITQSLLFTGIRINFLAPYSIILHTVKNKIFFALDMEVAFPIPKF